MNLGPGSKVYVERSTVFAAFAMDGPCDGDVYHVVTEFADGSRLAHTRTFEGFEIRCNEDTDGEVIVTSTADMAHAAADLLAARVRSAAAIDTAHWVAIPPRYLAQP